MRRKMLWISLVSVMALTSLAATLLLTRKPSFNGVVVSPPLIAAEIKLTDHNGNPFKLSEQHGKVVLLYFGYINCTDDCPLTSAHLKLALEDLGANAKNVQVIMVSTDPVRDTPTGLKEFMTHFNSDFLGLTGAQADLKKVWRDYWVHVEEGGESHGPSIFVIDPMGNIRELFSPESEPKDISADVALLLKGK